MDTALLSTATLDAYLVGVTSGFILDASHYQGGINWTRVAASGCRGVYIKVSDGAGGVDATWQANHAGALSVGLPAGPYHFAEGGNVSAEAAHFASFWPAGWQLHPVLDYEIGSANAGWLTAFRAYFRQDTGFEPFRVYTSVGMLTGQLNPANWIDGDTTIWAARYAASLGWTHPALVLWQNSDAAQIAGILGNVDEDQFENGWSPAVDQGGSMEWTDQIPFPTPANPTGTAPAEVCLANADLYAGNAMTMLADPKTGLAAIAAQIGALAGTLSTDEAAVLAAIKGITAGTVDVNALAAALVPLLAPADAEALFAEMKKLLDAQPPAAG